VLGHPLGQVAGYLRIGADGIRRTVRRAWGLRAVWIWAQLRVSAGSAALGLRLALRGLRSVLRLSRRAGFRAILRARLGLGPALRTSLRLRVRGRGVRRGGVLSAAGDGERRKRQKHGQARSLRGAERDARPGPGSLHGAALLFLLPVRSGMCCASEVLDMLHELPSAAKAVPILLFLRTGESPYPSSIGS
jgi:hypothetical protein